MMEKERQGRMEASNNMINYNIIFIMNNESNLSEYSNYSLIQPIKQQIYDFTSRSDRLYEENVFPIQFKNAMTIKTKPMF